jgi:hypothetical protein
VTHAAAPGTDQFLLLVLLLVLLLLLHSVLPSAELFVKTARRAAYRDWRLLLASTCLIADILHN